LQFDHGAARDGPRVPPLLVVLLDRVGELVEIGVERAEEARERMPAETSLAELDTRDERGVGAEQTPELSLRQFGAAAEHPEATAERELVALSRRCIVGLLWSNLRYPSITSKSSAGARRIPPPAWHRENKGRVSFPG
jgi:hypothetical protein